MNIVSLYIAPLLDKINLVLIQVSTFYFQILAEKNREIHFRYYTFNFLKILSFMVSCNIHSHSIRNYGQEYLGSLVKKTWKQKYC